MSVVLYLDEIRRFTKKPGNADDVGAVGSVHLLLFIKFLFEAGQDGGLRFDNQDSTFSGPAFGLSSSGVSVCERGTFSLCRIM